MLTTLLCALALNTVAPPAAADAEEPLVTRSFSLGALGSELPGEARALSPFPYSLEHEDSLDFELHGTLDTLLFEVVAPEEFEYEGRSFSITDDERMVVTAPERVVDDIAGLLDYLHAALLRRVEIELRVFSFSEYGGGESQLLHTERRSIPLERTTSLGGVTTHPFVRGWEIEIAQQSVIADPEVSELLSGVELLLRVEDAGKGRFRLRQAVRVSELLALDSRDVGRVERIMLDNQAWSGGGGLVQLPTVRTACAAGTQLLREGDARGQVLWLDTAAGRLGWTVEATLVAVDPEPEPYVVNGNTIQVMPLSRHLLPSYRVERPEAWWLDPGYEHGLRFDSTEELPHLHLLEGYQWDTPVSDVFERAGWDSEPMLIAELGNAVLIAGPTHRVPRVAQALSEVLPEHRKTHAVVQLYRGEQLLAHASLGLETGSDALLVLGDARSFYVDFDVDVANASAGSSPTLMDKLDGLALRLRAEERGLHVEGALQRLVDVGRSSAAPSGLDLPSFIKGDVDARVPLDSKKHTLGVYGGLTLRVMAETLH